MIRHQNLSGISGVDAYDIGDDYIKILFVGGETYLYSYDTPGEAHVKAMTELAKKGAGLSTYIAQHVRDDYDAKLYWHT